MSFLEWLLDTSVFVPRTHCGPGWDSGPMQALAQVAGVIGFAAFVFQPLAYRAMWHRWQRHGWQVLYFEQHMQAAAMFIWLCAITHLVGDVLIFYWPVYRLDVLFKVAMASWALVAMIYAVIELARDGD